MDLAHHVAGKGIVVTGASSGLGEHFARLLAGAGARVIAAARRTDRLAALAEEARAKGWSIDPLALDVTDDAAIAPFFEAVKERLGRLDILINNAGVADTTPALDLTPDAFDRVVDTNLRGAFFVAQGAARAMKEGGGGSIVNIASILALRVAGNVTPYAIAKAGLAQMTHALALEWARYNIRVNALAPGYLETELNADFFASPAGQALIKRIPQRRLSRLTDLDAPLLLLAGDAAPTLTGVVLPVDGGHLVSSL
ncbi:SDR family oxidoreductase [Xanthobacter sp. DSM 24535]|uniref:SDR family NAD(P)-dependent oxidoreductase n=1 Tax=Roseixanthobacter psychrophilus TaxID=3119917 RepID=UPI003727E6D1